MVSARDGSSTTTPRPAGSAPGPALPSFTSGSSHGPRLMSSETVIKEAGTGPAPLIDADSPSQQLKLKLFPPMQDEANAASLECAGVELDHFRIEERIGMGGMGAVFRAVDTRLQRHVALKLLAPGQSNDTSAVARFRNEARAAARLDHENIARVYYIGEERSLHFIAFEFVTGLTIRDLIRRRTRLSNADSVNYALQVAYALKHTSAMGVVHRDIKPSNIIITPSGRAKLVDLGLARKDSTESQGELTLPGTTLGTFDYISPEQAKDPRSVDVRSDIYSLGCTMYHMLTGQPPYPDGTVLQKLLDHQGKEAPDAAVLNPQVPQNLSAVVRKMMNSDRNRRYQTPDHLIRDLSLLAGEFGLRGMNPEGLVWVSPRGRRRESSGVGRWAGLFLLLFAVVAGLQWKSQILAYLAGPQSEFALTPPDRNAADPATSASNDSTAEQSGVEPDTTSAAEDIAAAATPVQTSLTATGSVTPTVGDTAPVGDLPRGPLIASTDTVERPTTQTATTIEGDAVPAGPNPRMIVSTQPRAAANAGPQSPATGGTATAAESATGVVSTGSAAIATDAAADDSRMPVTLISVDGSQTRRFKALWAACAEAEDGSTIELQFTGRRVEKPIRITRNVTIRAARDHAPVIEFVPSGYDTSDAGAAMITVQSGPLRLVNVGFHLTIPENAGADRYSLFSVPLAGLLELNRVGVTVENPSRIPAVVIDATSDDAAMRPDMPRVNMSPTRSELGIEASGCLFRGNASLANLAWQGQLNFAMSNSVAALSGDIFQTSLTGMTSGESATATLNLEHVSLLMGGALVRFNGPVPVNPPAFAVGMRNSIVSVSSGAALLDVSPDIMPDEFRRMIAWRGERNFYDDTAVFWRLGASGQSYGFEEWREYWQPDGEVGPNNDAVIWQQGRSPSSDLLWSEVDTGMFQLDMSEDSSSVAIQAATDGGDAGSDLTLLPSAFQPPVDDATSAVVPAVPSAGNGAGPTETAR